MSIAHRRVPNDARGGASLARPALLALLACGVACFCVATAARADPRFGDSTWVAPDWAFDSQSQTAGPRVASPDHERRWETALRTPFRVVFFPLRLVGKGIEAAGGYLGPRYVEPKATPPPKAGPSLTPYLDASSVSDIGVGPAVTWVGFPTADARLHLAGSWSASDHRRVHFSEMIGGREPLRFRVRVDYDYKPNRHFYGIGNSTPEADLSYYLLESTNAEAALLLGALPLRQLRIVGGYSSMSPRRAPNSTPMLEDVFPPTSAPYETRATRELSYGIGADLAVLDDGRDPSRGIHGRADLRRAAGMRSEDPDYDQWRLEGRAYVPVFSTRRVIALRGMYAGVRPRGGASAPLPFYRLAQSEGVTRFAGYGSERFRDQQLMVVRIEYRWQFLYRLSALGLYEVGAVAPSIESFALRDTHRSVGGGLRLGMSDVAALRFELAKSVEGMNATLSLGGDF